MPEFYMIIDRKIFSRILRRHVPPPSHCLLYLCPELLTITPCRSKNNNFKAFYRVVFAFLFRLNIGHRDCRGESIHGVPRIFRRRHSTSKLANETRHDREYNKRQSTWRENRSVRVQRGRLGHRTTLERVQSSACVSCCTGGENRPTFPPGRMTKYIEQP